MIKNQLILKSISENNYAFTCEICTSTASLQCEIVELLIVFSLLSPMEIGEVAIVQGWIQIWKKFLFSMNTSKHTDTAAL